MSEGFDRDFWKHKWGTEQAGTPAPRAPHPYLEAETRHLPPGRALDVGCGRGAEAISMAATGWQVTGLDISTEALEQAAAAAAQQLDDAAADRLSWQEADLTAWAPEQPYDLVMTSYAHTTAPQTELYRRIAEWTAPGGTLLIVGHTHHDHGHLHGASAELNEITELFPEPEWHRESAYEAVRETPRHTLHDVVVRLRRADAD